jgi:predicted Fe-S protein YdhL (DUF1289 family)
MEPAGPAKNRLNIVTFWVPILLLVKAENYGLPLRTLRPMESPCVKICTYDPGTGLCLGCGRSLEEIDAWFSMNDDERRTVMKKLPERLKRLSLPTR